MCEFYLNLTELRSLGLKGFWFSVFYRRRPLLIHPLPLPESVVLTLHGATTSYNTFPLSDAHVSIRFTDGTTFEELTDSDKSIPTEMFRFRNYDQLLALANTNRHLPHTLLKQPHAEEPEQVALSNRKDRLCEVKYVHRPK
ncbi:hypothetical protein Bca52824_060352 [Brassica carinata]|uniref:Uncharacterized protein n=1 Tax=Brassica carinata TaxID=52824 RepID=A0A8X7QXQ4_BRACI|nr:hypothetical protein Bca52824_060352 [Brassica carinata]